MVELQRTGLVQQLRKLVRRDAHTHSERDRKNAHMVCGMFRMIFSPRCQSERMCARSNTGADALPANVG